MKIVVIFITILIFFIIISFKKNLHNVNFEISLKGIKMSLTFYKNL